MKRTYFKGYMGMAETLESCALILRFFREPASKTKDKKRTTEQAVSWPVIEATVDDVRRAVRKFSDSLPKGVYRTILVKEDNSLDFEQLAPYLKGIPDRPYYMSRETYDIFEEKDKAIPPVIDKVQRAVDLYVKENKQYPMLPFDPLHRVNYYQLLHGHYLDEIPGIELYITNYDGLITHIRPRKRA
ncbi:DUF3939 domain-containing protein [Mesobacillus zeae]|uniref:DUF3939 domain-containing protein n=1 Tax=Mesobacillus zeae TaxID=1917180 RepID=A0A398BAE7_9BACI|nr:DUF3939 domain-containing protein [Mesobacillus zeae]RID84666.1 DUF3939 domain-containing protein [Mesobacillus zeae]